MSALLVLGCLSPTLPLPPPSRPKISSPDEFGNVHITGVAQSRATVFAYNVRTDKIVGEVTGDDGRYDLVMQAEVGDRIRVWQSINSEQSAAREVLVPAVGLSEEIAPPPAGMGGAQQ